MGFTAVKFDPVGPGTMHAPLQLSLHNLENAEAVIREIREAVGVKCDVIIGTHGQMTTSSAIRLARRLEQFDPLWFEEPIPPENRDEMARVADHTSIPIASGERLSTKYEFRELLEKQAASILQISLSRAGGILEAKKIAGMAEAYYAQIAPHLYARPGRSCRQHSIYAAMSREAEATLQTVSLEGAPLIRTFARSPLTGWTVAVGIAQDSLVGPLWRNLAITSALGAVLLLTGLAFAVRMATTIARGEMLHDLLIEELNHRVKNTLAILQAIAVQTFQSASKAERETFEGRLGALAEAHNLLSKEKWRGSDLQDVIGRVLQPYLLNNPERVRMSGPPVPLSPRLAVVLSMIVHEIATNAAKYGALSNDTGTVRLDWEILTETAQPKLRLIWAEAGGPHVTAPVKRGFGSRLIERSARDQLGGEATVDFLPGGVVYTITGSLEDEG